MIFDTRCASPLFLPEFDTVVKGRDLLKRLRNNYKSKNQSEVVREDGRCQKITIYLRNKDEGTDGRWRHPTCLLAFFWLLSSLKIRNNQPSITKREEERLR